MKNILATCALLCLTPLAGAADPFNVVFKAVGDYDGVRDLVQASIEGQGLKINHVNQIAGMLDRTGKDIGATRQVYEYAEQFEFCSAKISREMMEADPHAVVMCPYIISVYKMLGDKNVYIAYRKPGPARTPALKKALGDVEKLLSDIIKGAL